MDNEKSEALSRQEAEEGRKEAAAKSAAGSDKLKKGAAASAVAVVTAASVIVSGAVDSPEALLSSTQEEGPRHQIHLEASDIDNGLEPYLEEEEEESEEEDESEEAGDRESRLSRAIMRLPLWARTVLILPLYLLGMALQFLGSHLFTFLSPALARILSAILTVALVFGIFLLGAKLLFPKVKLRKFLNKKTLPVLLIGAIVLSAADLFLEAAGIEFSLKPLVLGLGHLGILSLALVLLAKHLKKQSAEAAEKKEKELLDKKEKAKEPIVVFTDADGKAYKIKTNRKEESHENQ